MCPSCGAEHATNRAECPSCGKRYDRRFARVSDTQRWILAGLALAGVIAAAVLILPGVFSAKQDNDAPVAAEPKRLIREQRPMRGRPDTVARPAAGASAAEQIAAKDGKVVGLFGHPFVGTADFKRWTYVIGAEGRPRVGDGYLSSTP